MKGSMAKALVAALAALLPAAHALFEDQAGVVDWFRANIGTVLHADFHTVESRRLLLVSTDASIVAAVDAATNQTAWRHVLPGGERVVSQVLHTRAGQLLVGSVTPEGALMARLWTVGGALLWDAHVPAPPPSAAVHKPTASFVGDSADVLALCGARVHVLRGRSGELVWSWEHAPATTGGSVITWQASSLSADQRTLAIHGLATGARDEARGPSQLARADLEVTNGALVGGVKLVAAGGGIDAEQGLLLTLEPRFAVAVSKAGDRLLFAAAPDDGSATAGAASSFAVPHSRQGGGDGRARLLPVALPGAVVVAPSPAQHVLLDLSQAAPEPHVAWERTWSAPGACGGLRSGAQAILACAAPSASGDALEQATMLVTAGSVESLPSPPAARVDFASHGAPAALFLGSYAKRDSAIAQRALLVSATGAAHYAVDGACAWTRDEALAHVEQLEFVDLPRVRDVAALEQGPQYGSLFRALGSLAGGGAAALAAASGLGARRHSPELTSDAFGFNKLMVVRTRSSKIVALSSLDGSPVWGTLPTLDGAPVTVHTLTVVPAPTSQPTDIALVVSARGADGADERYALITIDALKGEQRGDAHPLPQRVLWTISVGTPDAAAPGAPPLPLLALVHADFSVSLFPETSEAARAFEASARGAMHFFLLDRAEGVIKGYGLAARREGGGAAFAAVHRWSFAPPPNARGLSVCTLDSAEAVHSPVRVLGDRGVLHKYLNPNLLAVGYTQTGRGGAAGSSSELSVHVTVLDGVSGAAVHDFVTPRAAGPLRLALSENTLVAYARSAATGAPFVSVTELYENATAPNYMRMLLSGSDPDAESARSAFEPRAPFALSAAYYLPADVAAVGITQTTKGITPRHVMFALHSGQLLALDKRIFDPRRPKAPPSQADKEEGLMQYSPSVGHPPPTALVTHGHEVANVKGMRFAPTVLESTSVVALYGTDLFVARYCPAKEFDKLGDSFNHVALVGALVGLGAATVLSTFARRRKEVNRLWR